MKRSKFNLSYTHLTSCNMGDLVPIGLTEVLPGDSMQQATTCLVRCSAMLAPVMHPVHVQIAHWFVPHRLVWEDWEDFITGGEDGNDDSEFPTIDMDSAAVGSLADYLGVPPGLTGDKGVTSALPFRGYALIYNEWYRDQQLQTKLPIDLTSGLDTTTNTTLQQANWEKDYFTSARPYEQLGPQITIPIGTSAPVEPSGAGVSPVFDSLGGAIQNRKLGFNSGSGGVVWTGATPGATVDAVWDTPNLIANLTGASAVTINVIREAMALQRFEEARNRFGARYVEYLRYLGVRSSDARLQRPEFLGGGRYPMQFSEVLQTAEGTDPVGELRGHGIGVSRSNRYRRFFEEHGYIFTFMTVKPKTIYTNGIFRHWNRRTKEDFFQKELQHIGQQAIEYREVYAPHSTPTGTFGYQDRYDEYRRSESRVSSTFRNGQNLDFWHFARAFSSDPALNSTFVKCVPTEEPFAVPSENVLYVMAKHSIQARRIVAASGTSFIY